MTKYPRISPSTYYTREILLCEKDMLLLLDICEIASVNAYECLVCFNVLDLSISSKETRNRYSYFVSGTIFMHMSITLQRWKP